MPTVELALFAVVAGGLFLHRDANCGLWELEAL